MDSLHDLLSNKDFDEPPEVASIKNYVRDMFGSVVGVTVRERDLVVRVPSAALASRLRFDMKNLRAAAGTDKKIILRIGK